MAATAQHVAQAVVRGDTRHARSEFNALAATTTKTDAAMMRTAASVRAANKSILNAAGGVAALTAGFGLAVSAVNNSMDRVVELSNVYEKLAFSVDAAAIAVGNQTDKMFLATQANQLNTAGIIETSEEYAKYTGIIAALADAHGKELEPTIRKNTKALLKGSEGAARELGVYVDLAKEAQNLGHSLSLTEKRQILVNALMEQGSVLAEEHGVAIETSAHKWVAFRNELKNWKDAALDAAFGTGQVANEAQRATFQAVELMSRINPLTGAFHAAADAVDVYTVATEEMTLAMAMAQIQATRQRKEVVQSNNKIAEAFEASRQAIEDSTAAEAKALKRDIAIMEAAGASAESLSADKSKLAAIEAANAEAKGEAGKAEEIRLKNEIRLIKAATAAEKGRRGGKGADPEAEAKKAAEAAAKAEKERLDGERQAIENIIEARNRESEVFRATSQNKLELIEDELERKQIEIELRKEQLALEQPETEAERLALLQEGRQLDHDHKMALLEAESARREELHERRQTHEEELKARQEKALQDEIKLAKKRMNAQREMANAITMSANSIVSVMEAAANASGEISRKEAIAVAVGKGLVTMAVGAAAVAEGAVNIASQNYVKGIPQVITGTAAIVTGGLLMAGQIQQAAGGAGDNGGRGGAGGADAGPINPGGAGGGGFGGGAGGGPGGAGNVPISPLDPSIVGTGGSQPQSAGNGGGGQTINLNVQGDVIGGSADDIATSLFHKLEDSKARTGETV